MPKLKANDGETVADGLTAEELQKLRDMGVEFDVDESDADGDETSDRPEPGSGGDEGELDTEPGSDADGDESGETPGADDASGEGDRDPDDGSDGADDHEGGELADSEGGADPDDGDGEGGDVDDEGEGAEGGRPDSPVGDGKIDPDSSDDLAEEFKDRDRDEMLEEEFDVDMDSIREPDERDRARWASLVNQLSEYGKNVPRRKRERDEAIGSKPVRKESDQLEREVRKSGAISDLEDGFRKLVSRPTPRPARSGPQIDMQNVTRKAAGDVTVDELFEESVEVETGDRCIGLSTDISGSMGSDIVELKKAGGIIAEATDIVGDAFVWNAFTDKGGGGLDLKIVTGPQEDFKWRHVDSFTSASNEPTAAGIRDCRMLMEKTAKRQYVMIVITDGKAMVGEDGTFYGSSSNVPVEHAREAVRECRDNGIDVIGLGIGGMSDKKMRETFGEGNYKLTSIDDLADDILELYEDQMNVSRR